MFPARYFPNRMFAPRYWPKIGSSIIIVPDPYRARVTLSTADDRRRVTLPTTDERRRNPPRAV